MNSVSGRVAELSSKELSRLLAQGQFGLVTGSLVSRIKTNLGDIGTALHSLYANHPFQVEPDFADFHVEIAKPWNLRRWIRPQVDFRLEGERPFEPLPRDQAPAFLEWGLNWGIASYCHQWFSLHAASLEHGGRAVILPAPPGSGKSTLCATLALRDWRLLSDELTLISPQTGTAHALARPINLKNASIDVIRNFEPSAVWGPETYDTAKGHVTHLRPPPESVFRMNEPAMPRWIVFPRYEANAEPLLTPKAKADTFAELAKNAFNYNILGETAFTVVADIVTQCDCYDFVYSQLDDAIEAFAWLASPDSEEQ